VRLKLHNLHTDHIVIRSELKYLIGAKVARKIIWQCGPASTWASNGWFMSGSGNNPNKTEWVGLFGGSWPGPWPCGRFQPVLKLGHQDPFLTLARDHAMS
jgi:hypothetical protein